MDQSRLPLGVFNPSNINQRSVRRDSNPRQLNVSLPKDIIVTRLNHGDERTDHHPGWNEIKAHNRRFEEQIKGEQFSEDEDLDLSLVDLKVREDVGLSDEDLLTISTKDLNRLLKKLNIGKARGKELKRERRTLKNRGYAANCRVKRDDMEEILKAQLVQYTKDIRVEAVLLQKCMAREERLLEEEKMLDFEIDRMKSKESLPMVIKEEPGLVKEETRDID
ncbi:hypothetical protein TCAL_13489 [Tigriopus californicus]|uniref:Basic leucine zipper domain-containing protein n=1 Tax=Tigriopus californicus TaxID=6832 RepID=A0A553PSW8_TIGCA|nr:transcription factor MafA-like [Tigriopus californicus]TRY80764.1 hypothetical protein TCAL_13489 [Tigriopus californicus]